MREGIGQQGQQYIKTYRNEGRDRSTGPEQV